MSKKFFVVGGEYADTDFANIANGHQEENYGPFDEHEADVCWRALTGKSSDNAMVRYFVRACETAIISQWFVTGGEYSDTSFSTIAEGAKRQFYGPFTRRIAIDKWRSLTGKTVDNAMMRYDLCTEDEKNLFEDS